MVCELSNYCIKLDSSEAKTSFYSKSHLPSEDKSVLNLTLNLFSSLSSNYGKGSIQNSTSSCMLFKQRN